MTSAAPARFTVATYNIHKGFSQLARRIVIHELREAPARAGGGHPVPAGSAAHERPSRESRIRDWPRRPQHEFIAGEFWNEVAYGRNAVYPHGHHGNAVLSRFPMLTQENLDISAHLFESRGLLHCEIELGRRHAERCIA